MGEDDQPSLVWRRRERSLQEGQGKFYHKQVSKTPGAATCKLVNLVKSLKSRNFSFSTVVANVADTQTHTLTNIWTCRAAVAVKNH